jgi:hypothetical protein
VVGVTRRLSDRRLRFRRSPQHPAGRIQLYIEWRDLWVGGFVSTNAVYLILLPTLVLRVATRPGPDLGDPLDHAMWVVWMESATGKWRWVTGRMTTEAREAAVAAVLRYDRRLKERHDPEMKPMARERVAWWD